MPKMTLHIEADTIEELRAQAILALDLAILTKSEANTKIAELLIPVANEIVDPASEVAKNLDTSPAEAEAPKKRGRKPKAEPSISEVAAAIEPASAKPLDLESVKEAFSQYSAKFGVAAAQEDGPKLLGRIFGEGVVNRIRDVPVTDQLKLGRVIAAVEGALLTNEFKRDVVQ